jgi:ubiquinol-cytochrome c reductase cytochrome b subunit
MASGERVEFKNPVVNWVDERLPVFTMIQKEYGVFPTPKNFNYFWNFGAIAMVMLILMIVTGIVLAMQYTADSSLAFESVERIVRDVNYGWLLRYLHMNGASFFFIAVYIHIFRGMYYGSYKRPRELLWMLGVVIFVLMMATAFMGYTLPWSQMSGWGATVITNLFSAIPWVGDKIVTLLWGGFSVDNPTLKRFFALHYLFPFLIVGVVFLHVWALHITGSNNPLGVDTKGKQDTLPFHPYYTIKDTFGLVVFLTLFAAVVFFAPDMFSHPDHYVEYDPMKTPSHIVPEWYFLPFYAILRAITFDVGIPLTDIVIIPAKLGGVLAMFGSVGLLFVMPFLDWHPVRSARFRPMYKVALLFLTFGFFVLMYIGAETADAQLGSSLKNKLPLLGFVYHIPFVKDIPLGAIGLAFTAYHFAFFLVILPVLSVKEKVAELPKSIHQAVTQKK